MKALLLTLGLMIVAGPIVGCGTSDTPPPADKSNLPDEVKAEEEKFEANNAKRSADLEKRKGPH